MNLALPIAAGPLLPVIREGASASSCSTHPAPAVVFRMLHAVPTAPSEEARTARPARSASSTLAAATPVASRRCVVAPLPRLLPSDRPTAETASDGRAKATRLAEGIRVGSLEPTQPGPTGDAISRESFFVYARLRTIGRRETEELLSESRHMSRTGRTRQVCVSRTACHRKSSPDDQVRPANFFENCSCFVEPQQIVDYKIFELRSGRSAVW